MKKRNLYFLMFIMFLFLPSLVRAESCRVVSGIGKDIGDEVVCGTESFYILSNDGEEVKMLAKYNLYVGRIYYKVEFDQTFDNWNDAKTYWVENYASEYDGYFGGIVNDNSEYYGVFAYKDIEVDEVKQSSEAIGAHGDLKVEPLFPEVGVYNGDVDYEFWNNYLYPTYDNYRYPDSASFEVKSYNEGYIDVEIDLYSEEEALLLDYFHGYEEFLEKQGITTSNMTLLSVGDISNLVYSVTGEELPLTDWWNGEWGSYDNGFYGASVVGRIADHLPEEYNWLWSTTYWTRTWAPNYNEKLYFVDTLGDLCNDYFCTVSIGAGVRPVVTIEAETLIYNIETRTDGNGTVTASHVTSESGQEIEFTVEPKEGYTLKKVVVTTSTGEVLEFTDYKFTMPDSNVEIYAEFEKIVNPNTGLNNPFIICGSILVIALIGSIVVKRKKYI